MYQFIIIIHVFLGLGIIGLVMMQQGKGAEAGASFGGGASGSVFGAQGAASFLSRSTAILATLFFITSLTLAVYNGRRAPTDIMSGPNVKQDVPSVTDTVTVPGDKPVTPPSISQQQAAPSTEAAIPAVPVPPVVPAPIKAEVQPTTAPAAKAEEKLEQISVPKPEPIKAVETEAAKAESAVKEENKAKSEKNEPAKDKKADAHHSKKADKSSKDKKEKHKKEHK